MSDLPPQPPQRPTPPSGPPEYNVYRSRRRLRDRLGPAGRSPLDALKKRRERGPREPRDPRVPGQKPAKPVWRRVLKYVVLAVVAWILIAIVAFFVSAQTAPGVGDSAKQALDGGGSMLTGSTILVLGSDQRPKGTKEPGASTSGPSRSDSILLMHVGVGSVRKLSILRDTHVDIPGHGSGKINAAYAYGGAPLTIKTIKGFLGNPDLHINHLVEVSFTDFPKLIDALGGIDVKLKKCIRSNSFGGKRVRLTKGEHHLNGDLALRFARVRENSCDPTEDDRTRAKRQQQVLSAMRDQIASPSNWPSAFVRAPFIAWQAPRAIRSDVHGPGLSALFLDLLTGGTGKTSVLLPDGPSIGGDLSVSPAARKDAVDKLLGR